MKLVPRSSLNRVDSRSPLALGIVLLWSAACGHVALGAGLKNISWEIEAETRYVGDTTIRGGGTRASTDELQTDLSLALWPQVTPDLLLHLGADWQRFSFDVPQRLAIPSVLQKVSAIIGLDYQLGDAWLLRAEVQPGVYNDLQDVRWNDVGAPLLLGAAYLANADLQWFFGLRLDLRSRYPVIPAVGLRWRFADEWTLNLQFPNPRLEYQLSEPLKAYLGLGLDMGTFTVGDHFGSERGRLDLNGATLDYSEIRVAPGLAWKIGQKLSIDFEAGYMVYRRFEFSDPHRIFRSDPAPFVQMSAQIRF